MIGEVAGRRIVACTMRQDYCTDALSAGATYADLARMVGNSPTTPERVYDHPVHERFKEQASLVASRLRKPG